MKKLSEAERQIGRCIKRNEYQRGKIWEKNLGKNE